MKITKKTAITWSLLLTTCYLGAAEAPAPKPQPASPAEKAASPGKIRRVGVEEFDKLRADKANTVLDVRTPDEFAKGHIPGAVLLDFNSPDFPKKVAQLDKNKTYLVHCAAGGRSAKACALMDKLEFKNLVDLQPGFRAWEKAGKPVEH